MTRPPQRVALVHDWLTGMRGGEKVLEVLASRFPEAPIFTLFHFPGSVSEELQAHEIHTSFLQRAPGLRRHYRRYLPFFPAAIEDLDLSGFDLVVSTSHCVAKGILPGPGSRHICYCHTPMRYAWDQERAYFPNRRGLVSRLRGLALTGLRTWDVVSSRRVDDFLANSRFVAERIRRYYGRTAVVVPPPVDVDFYRPADEEPGVRDPSVKTSGRADSSGTVDSAAEPNVDRKGHRSAPDGSYCLIVSALAPYKRLEVAIRACEEGGYPLKVVGQGPEAARLEKLAGKQTEFLGWVGAEELRELYRGARFLLQPGVEDFGIAPVEALACGTPVVAQGRGGVLDIVEDGEHGALYTGDDSPSDLRQAIDRAAGIGFNSLNLRLRAESFSTASFLRRLEVVLAEEPSGT
ncbi:MAG: glycosyltransferase [Acidobacteria bacterium]|nr:glycosyltransferase [Acidobacteriota bacterium]